MSNETKTSITFFGTSPAIPDIGGDSPTFLINNKYLVDTGWTSIHNMRIRNIDPLRLEYLFFTHFHHDHYLSLPSLLFYILMKGKPLNQLKITGPAQDLERIVRLAMDFLQAERYYTVTDFPTLVPLNAGDVYEEEYFRISVCPTVHPVPSLCYRFTDRSTGSVISFTGDTAYHPPIAEHVGGSDILVHEAALGPIEADPNHNHYLHSGALDAAKIAAAADVGKLLLLHMPDSKAASCVESAKRLFSREVAVPKVGETFVI